MERKLQTERQMHQNDVERMEKRVSETLRHANESERARTEQIQKEAALKLRNENSRRRSPQRKEKTKTWRRRRESQAAVQQVRCALAQAP